jgi:hypothetical protein
MKYLRKQIFGYLKLLKDSEIQRQGYMCIKILEYKNNEIEI